MSLCRKIPEDVLPTDVENLIMYHQVCLFLNPDLQYEAVCCLLRACCLSAANRRDAGWFFITRGWGRRTGWAGGHNSGWSHHYKLWICLHPSVWGVTKISLKSALYSVSSWSCLVSSELSQGDVELPEVPSDELPEVPEASEKKAGLFSHMLRLKSPSDVGCDKTLNSLRVDPILFQLWHHSECCRYNL